jgi:hypothetical protein
MNHRRSHGATNKLSSNAMLRMEILVLACIVPLLQTRIAAQQPKLQAHRTVLDSGSSPGSEFGYAVAASGDTVVVTSFTNGLEVYVKPAGGWAPSQSMVT